ncbi:MAG: murein L,D-transpeptidase catalytic domain family protein, partial [Bacteroidales bacterium]|nr:murein L,D-transpeptidase catalytic domain family protein [Bacteroidales bacterium]
SMLLNGVDTGFNENARKRSIVMHGADYATHHYVKKYGRLGRSFGCPALPPDDNTAVINLIRDGSVVFGYFPSSDYLSGSCILKGYVKDSLLAALRY